MSDLHLYVLICRASTIIICRKIVAIDLHGKLHVRAVEQSTTDKSIVSRETGFQGHYISIIGEHTLFISIWNRVSIFQLVNVFIIKEIFSDIKISKHIIYLCFWD